jgi:hypothetical protein
MSHPPENDPNMTYDINRQDQFFGELARAKARYEATLPKAPVISSLPAAPPLLPLGVRGVNVDAHMTRRSPKKRPAERDIWIDHIVGLIPLALFAAAIDIVLIATDAGPPPEIIFYSVLVMAGIIAVFLLVHPLAKAMESFFTSRSSVLITVGLIIVAGVYFCQQI